MQKENLLCSDLKRVHFVITRALNVIENKGNELIQSGRRDELSGGFYLYMDATLKFVHNHHVSEENVMFPELKKYNVDIPIRKFSNQHDEMLPVMAECEDWLEECNKNSKNLEAFQKLIAAFTELNNLWKSHYCDEENGFCTNHFSELIPEKDKNRIAKKVSRHGRSHAKPGSLILPFIIFNLPLKERQEFKKQLPGIVTGFMIPLLWKKRWQNMKPYLLETNS